MAVDRVVMAQLSVEMQPGEQPERPGVGIDDLLREVMAALRCHDVTTAREGTRVVVIGGSAAVMDAIEHAHLAASSMSTNVRSDITFLSALPHARQDVELGPPACGV